MEAIAIIPARGGSKRLPRKNIVDFLGRPIIAYTIDAAYESGCFERVVVSTEDDEIAGVAQRCGAAVEPRPTNLATDMTGVVDVCLDVLEREAARGRRWPIMGCLYPTAPLRSAADIRATVALLRPGICEFAMGVTSYDLQPHLALKLAPDGGLAPMWPDLIDCRASDLPPLRISNGTTYAVLAEAFCRARTFYGPGLRGYDMPRKRSIDIDTSDDLDFAVWTATTCGFGKLERRDSDMTSGQERERRIRNRQTRD
jgi:pseudaminic acid cytidylyltransferase